MSNGSTPTDNSHRGQRGQELVLAQPTERSDVSHLPPGDERYRSDKQLMSSLTELNGQVARYVLRHLDSQAGHVVAISPDDEHVLGMRLVDIGVDIIGRSARRRRSHGDH